MCQQNVLTVKELSMQAKQINGDMLQENGGIVMYYVTIQNQESLSEAIAELSGKRLERVENGEKRRKVY